MVHDAQADESRLALTVKELQVDSAALRMRLTQQEAEVWSVCGGRDEAEVLRGRGGDKSAALRLRLTQQEAEV